MKPLMLVGLLISSVCHASQIDTASLQASALQTIRSFNPATIIPGYTTAPSEVALNPNTLGNDAMKAAAKARVQKEETLRFTMTEARRHEHEAKVDISQVTEHGEDLLDKHEGEAVDVPCADGSCDNTVAEESNDMAEGITELGVIAGTAEDASTHQTQTNQPNIFSGASQACKSLPLGLHDCCTGSGPLDWLVNCPGDMQVLQRAKLEGRVVDLGYYKRHKAGHKHHVYCVFPTKLAGVIQIQGRSGQLHIPFGAPKYPNCRGLSPEELQRIDFHKLNLKALTTELTRRKHLPDASSIDAAGENHANELHRKGAAHD